MSAEPSVTVGPGEVSLHWGPGHADLAIVAADGLRMLQRGGSVRLLGDHTALILTARGDVATGCRDGAVRLVRAGSQQLQQLWQVPPGERIDDLAWSDDGAWLAVKSHARVYLVAVR